MECVASGNLKNCTCTYLSCTRRGQCCQCVMHHRRSGELPGCFFTKEGEAAYDRSLAFFLQDQAGRQG